MDPNPPALLNFPKGSNETELKLLVCRLAKSLQTDLEFNVHAPDVQKRLIARTFNWTDFSTKTIEIYRYIDAVIHEKDPDYVLDNLEKLKRDFRISWSSDLSVKDAFEIG